MTIVHSSQLYKRSKFRYKPTTLSLHLNELEETELRYGRSGCRERVVPWCKVLGVHVRRYLRVRVRYQGRADSLPRACGE